MFFKGKAFETLHNIIGNGLLLRQLGFQMDKGAQNMLLVFCVPSRVYSISIL